ncbi:hypothetical protein ACET3Z_012250 [Daucus carota]
MMKRLKLPKLDKENGVYNAMPSKGKKVNSTKDSDTTPRPTTNSNIPIPDVVVPEFSAEGQGGVFGSYSQPARVENTPLGIQPQRFMVRGNHVTTLRQIEAEASARRAKLQTRPPWK